MAKLTPELRRELALKGVEAKRKKRELKENIMRIGLFLLLLVPSALKAEYRYVDSDGIEHVRAYKKGAPTTQKVYIAPKDNGLGTYLLIESLMPNKASPYQGVSQSQQIGNKAYKYDNGVQINQQIGKQNYQFK